MFADRLINPQIIEPINSYGGVDYANRIIQVLIYLGFALCALAFFVLFVIGGISYITASGDKQKLEGGRTHIINGITGLVVLLILWIVIGLFNSIFGINIGGIGGLPAAPSPIPQPTSVPVPTPVSACDSVCTSFSNVYINGCTPQSAWDTDSSDCDTYSNTVNLYLGGVTGADRVEVMNFPETSVWCFNDSVNWTGANSYTYSSGMTLSWDTIAGLGEKKVCARFIDSTGATSCCGGEIEVIFSTLPTPTTAPTATPTPACGSTCVSFSDVYINGCTPLSLWSTIPLPAACITNSDNVTLNLALMDADVAEVQISNFIYPLEWCDNDNHDWSGVATMNYSNPTSLSWTTYSSDGVQKVCARFIRSDNTTMCCGGQILVEP